MKRILILGALLAGCGTKYQVRDWVRVKGWETCPGRINSVFLNNYYGINFYCKTILDPPTHAGIFTEDKIIGGWGDADLRFALPGLRQEI